MQHGIICSKTVAESQKQGYLSSGISSAMIDIEMSSYQDVLARLYMHSAGDTVNVSIIRGGESKQIGVVLQ